jgi:hypothetical protein
MKCREKACPIANNMDMTRSTPAEKKATVKALYDLGTWSQPMLAKKFGVDQAQISRWLQLCGSHNSAPAKTKANPRGAGRPKGRKAPKRHDKADQVMAAADAGKSNKEIAATTGVSERQVRHTIEEETIRREAEAQIDPATLSMTAQQKLDAALRQYQRKLDIQFEQRVAAEVDRRINAAFPLLKEKQQKAEAIALSYTARFSKTQCQDVARCLHPDTWQALTVPAELATRLRKAFVVFGEMQSRLCVE